MFPKRDRFRSVQEFLEKYHEVLYKRLKEDLSVAKIKDIPSESQFIIKVNDIFMISLSELKMNKQPHFILIIDKVDNKSITFHFQDLDALYQLFINLAKNGSFLNSIPLLVSCLADPGHYAEKIFIEKNPFNPDI